MEIKVGAGEKQMVLFEPGDDSDIQVLVEENGSFVGTWVDWQGSDRVVNVKLLGAKSQAKIFGVTVLNGDNSSDTKVTIEHLAEETVSSLVWANVLNGSSKVGIAGRIIVRPKAQLTKSNQSVKTLLLSDKARVNVKPELEVFADQVKCTHGATCGVLDPDQLKFLQMRGLAESEAKKLLQVAFLRPSLSFLKEEDRKEVMQQIKKQLK